MVVSLASLWADSIFLTGASDNWDSDARWREYGVLSERESRAKVGGLVSSHLKSKRRRI